MNESDLARFHHMHDAAKDALQFIEGKSRTAFDDDLMLLYAVEKALEIIGEAASKISAETRQAYPQIEWKQIIGMRNLLVHGYIEVNLEQVWKTATEDLPPLVAQLEKIIPPDDPII